MEPTRRHDSEVPTDTVSDTALTPAMTTVRAHGRPERIAHAISMVFLPPLVAVATFSVVSIHLSTSSLEALLYAVVASVFVAILPVGAPVHRLRQFRIRPPGARLKNRRTRPRHRGTGSIQS